MQLNLAGGTYSVAYVVTSAKGGSCSSTLFLTESDGYENLMASAFPTDETIRDTESDSDIAAGPAVARVESDCPHWSAKISLVSP